MTDTEKKDYCEGNIINIDNIDYNKKKFPGYPSHIFYNNNCSKLKSEEECKEETPDTEEPIFFYKLDIGE